MAIKNSFLHITKKGLVLPIAGEPEQRIEPGRCISKVALMADDYIGMRPTMKVQVGDKVRRGQALFEDRKIPGVIYTSPGAGTVSAINRGERRAFRSLVIDLDDSETKADGVPAEIHYETLSGKDFATMSSDEVRAALLESGLWTAFRTRPFGKVPAAGAPVPSVFVTAMDTNPLAPDVSVVLEERKEDFKIGLEALAGLCDKGRVYLCIAQGSNISSGSAGGVETHEFKGPHPSGTVGLHIHTIEPAGRERTVWHVGYQDVIAMGHFFSKGRLSPDRVVSLAGPQVIRPRLVRTRVGASLDALVQGEIKEGENRTLSGSVFNGRGARGEIEGYLGRYHNQVTVLKEGSERRFMGWLAPGFDRFSIFRLFASKLLAGKKFDFNTDLNGGRRGLVPVGAYERVMPFDLMPTFLLRSLLAKDKEKAEELGALELDEEDVSLCAFVCPSKNEYGAALREMLTELEKEG